MTHDEKRIFRSDLFRHLDGIVTVPIAYALYRKGVIDEIDSCGTSTAKELSKKFGANEGYLNVGLRNLAAQGWIIYRIENGKEIMVSKNDQTAIALSLIPIYEDVVSLIQYSGHFHPRRFEREPFLELERVFQKFKRRFDLLETNDSKHNEIQNQILKHIEGALIGPTIVALGMSGMFHKYFMEASFKPEEFHADADSFGRLLDMFTFLDWFEKKNGTYRFTTKGLFYARRASAYGVTVSYIPTFRHIEELIFGDPKVLWNVPKGSKEIHVDREMNVWGSGGAHSTYFKKIDEIIISIFNRPIKDQPKGIVDMGCGNGAFLMHIFDVIEKRTIRGAMLEDEPLFLVGADFNEAALKVTKSNLIQADIWAKVIWGDIGRPDLLARDLEQDYGIQLIDLLNVRTFLDHNRIWEPPANLKPDRNSTSTGAFAFRGERISNDLVEENLWEHFSKWAPYVRKFGLLVIELHTIAPDVIAQNLGRTAATAYDATHGFSDQYIVEMPIFQKIAAEAGLHSVDEYFTRFPDSDHASISIQLLRAEK